MTVRWFEQSLADVPAFDDWLGSWELSHLGGLHIPKRRADWRLGRWTAKCALSACLNLPPCVETFRSIQIRPAVSGAPEAFLNEAPAHVPISLSHSGGVAACAVTTSGTALGCDLELVEPRTDAFVADYFTSPEQFLISKVPVADRFALISLIWSAKESALKALRTGLRIDTRCVSVTVHDGVQGLGITGLQGTSPESCDAASEPFRDWHTIEAKHAETGVLHGRWSYKYPFVRTLVCFPSQESIGIQESPLRRNSSTCDSNQMAFRQSVGSVQNLLARAVGLAHAKYS